MKLKRTTADMTGLWQVKRNKALHWPRFIIDPANSRGSASMSNGRGATGYVVDMDLPEEKLLVRTQERFLEKAFEEHADPQDPQTFPRPAVNWMVQEGYLTGQARLTKRAQAHVKDREKAAASPPSVLPGLSISAPKPVEEETPQVRTPRPKPEEATDAVEGEEAAS